MAARSTEEPGFQLTERDLLVLCDLMRFGPLRAEQLAERHDFKSERAAVDRLRKLKAHGFLGDYDFKTYRPTWKGAHATEMELSQPGEPKDQLRHNIAVADLARWLLKNEPDSEWVTERELRHELLAQSHAKQISYRYSGVEHVPDGKLILPGGAAAVELELTKKASPKYDLICRWFGQALAYRWFRWYVKGHELEDRLIKSRDRHDLAEFMSVEQVPSAVRVLSWTG